MEDNKNEVMVLNCAYPALNVKTEDNITEEEMLMAEEMAELGGVQLKLPKIKLGASGNGKLDVPDNNNPDESRQVKELEGVIICALASRAKWNEGDTIPECSSKNGKESIDGKSCLTCKLCKFTKTRDGQLVRPECKESRNLYILTKEHNMPLQFVIPPSGIKAYDEFARTILSSKKTQLGTIVKISVDIKTNTANQKYNCAKFESVGRVEPELFAGLLKIKKQITEMLSTMSVEDVYSDSATMTEINPEEDNSMPF